MIRSAVLALALLVPAAAAVAAEQHAIPPAFAAIVAAPDRPATDKVNDTHRHPGMAMFFAGVKPGMTIAELGSGGGYYTRMLANAVGPNGKVYAIMTKAQAARPNGMDAINLVIKDHPNVSVVTVDSLPTIVLPTKADLFWTTENYHDFHNGPTANIPGLDKAVYDNLKPGGIFYVEDHSAAPGAGLEAASKYHRMDEALAKTELTAAGFKLDGEDDALRNPDDNRATSNSEAGHFVTDRFMTRWKK